MLERVAPGARITLNLLRVEAARGRRLLNPGAVQSMLAEPEAFHQLVRSSVRLHNLLYARPDGYRRRRLYATERSRAVLDVNNLAWTLRDRRKEVATPVSRVINLVGYLRERGFTWIYAVGDANLSLQIAGSEDPVKALGEHLDGLETVPRGVPADPTILETARRTGAALVGNDAFRDFRHLGRWYRRDVGRVRITVAAAGKREPFDLGDAHWELADPPSCEP